MGAWGHGPFEDDAALDFVREIEEAENPKEIIIEALDNAADAAYLEADEANAAIVSAAYIDNSINGTKYTTLEMSEPYEVDSFSTRFPDLDLSDLKSKAVAALKVVIAEGSELKELWEESQEPAWLNGIEEMIKRLA
ncbi:DUF4259 domain-containing protein [Pedobacter sp. MC2016-14]|uniref:DUF4259 domain-containing protein n=1 Tax=Pedobacter sp. MC2016-14 TaxID=2897327 RepID=UPI001E5376CF|nr:DUF4259 domain-containing protein [Pedobacter sp. MC2016-14]MCD0489088.1 DUF4259 domain-containing protein [Pedobacter sp. MC2016-14]